MVKKYKYILLITVILFAGIMAVVFLKKGDGLNDGNAQSSTGEPRIPKLEEGVNVHELENEIFAVLGPESVAITTNRSSGSGILWQFDGQKIVVVTTKHLMQAFTSGELELWTGEKATFKKDDVYISEEADLAVIKISCEEKLALSKVDTGAYLVENMPEIGASVWVIDSVYGAASGIGACTVAASDMFLEDYGMEMLLLYGEGKNGMSGSPMYDVDGNLVAMMSGMSEDGTTLAAVPADKIMKFLESLEE